MKAFESIKRHRRVSGAVAAAVLALGGVEFVAQSDNFTYPIPADTCLSPFAVSNRLVDPAASLVWNTWTGINASGAVARGRLRPGALGVVGGFSSPTDRNVIDSNHPSRMLPAGADGTYTIKFALGPDFVRFGTAEIAPAGSPLCDTRRLPVSSMSMQISTPA